MIGEGRLGRGKDCEKTGQQNIVQRRKMGKTKTREKGQRRCHRVTTRKKKRTLSTEKEKKGIKEKGPRPGARRRGREREVLSQK